MSFLGIRYISGWHIAIISFSRMDTRYKKNVYYIITKYTLFYSIITNIPKVLNVT